MVFGEKLKLLRNEKGLTQEELAEQLGVSRQAVSKWESGTGYPETEKMLQLAKMFNASLDYLLLDDYYVEEQKENEPQTEVRAVAGRIAIANFDKSCIVNCISVKSSNILFAGKREPKYILSGVDKVTFCGEHSTTLGFYADFESIQKEIAAINEALKKGLPAYELQYMANVEYVGFFAQPVIKEQK